VLEWLAATRGLPSRLVGGLGTAAREECDLAGGKRRAARELLLLKLTCTPDADAHALYLTDSPA
jgi:hypothetical protein